MTKHRITITPGEPKPGLTRIEIDGHDISNAVTGVGIQIKAQQMPTVLLTLAADNLDQIDGDAEVWLPSETWEALVALGWTPPALPESEPK